MNSGQLDISTIIIVGVIAFIGVIVLVVGNRKNKRILRMVGIAFLMGAGVGLFVMSAEVREILTALAALIAVIIAAFSINESRRIRQDSIERESRDRKERLVNEVTNWLRELESHIFFELGTIKSVAEDALLRAPEISRETWGRIYDLDIALANINALSAGIKEAEYYQRLTSKLNEGLSDLIEVIVNDLKQRKQLVIEQSKSPLDYGEMDKASQLMKELTENDDRPLEGMGLSDQAIISVRLTRNAHAIRKSILNAVDKAIELKTSLIQVS
jgi:uncharacterized membrane protein